MTATTILRGELIEMFEDQFVCMAGERKAWFEIPQKGGESVRGIYVVYSVRGTVLDDVRRYFIDRVIGPLVVAASNTDKPNTRYLYWRMEERLQVREDHGWFTIYTRICVIDNDLNSIVLPDIVKTEGGPTPICAYSAGAY